jgi:hypothetical protein
VKRHHHDFIQFGVGIERSNVPLSQSNFLGFHDSRCFYFNYLRLHNTQRALSCSVEHRYHDAKRPRKFLDQCDQQLDVQQSGVDITYRG